MTALNNFRQGLPTEKTTSLNRLIGFVFGVANIPTFIFGTIIGAYGCMFIVTLPFILAGYIPGTILFFRYWKIYRDRATAEDARKTWLGTIVFNMILIFVTIIIGMANDGPWQLYIGILFQIAAMVMANFAYNDLMTNGPESIREETEAAPQTEMNPQA